MALSGAYPGVLLCKTPKQKAVGFLLQNPAYGSSFFLVFLKKVIKAHRTTLTFYHKW